MHAIQETGGEDTISDFGTMDRNVCITSKKNSNFMHIMFAQFSTESTMPGKE